MKKVIHQLLYITLTLTFLTTVSACTTFKTIEETEKESKEVRQQYSFEGTLFKMFICFEPSLKGDIIFIDNGLEKIFDGYLNTCTSLDVGLCDTFEVYNSGAIDLKINGRLFVVPSSKVLSFRYLIVKKEKNKYIFKYTNYPNHM